MARAWTLQQLKVEMNKDLAQCNSQLERDCCYGINAREIKDLAYEIQKTRKLNPGEMSILLNI